MHFGALLRFILFYSLASQSKYEKYSCHTLKHYFEYILFDGLKFIKNYEFHILLDDSFFIIL